MKTKRDIIPIYMLEAAIAAGWEVVGYSEFVGGIPKYVDIQYIVK